MHVIAVEKLLRNVVYYTKFRTTSKTDISTTVTAAILHAISLQPYPARGRILVQVTIYRRLMIGRDPSRPIISLRYIVTCTRIRPCVFFSVTFTTLKSS